MTKMSGVKSNPTGEIYAFQLHHMLAHIRKNATTAKAKEYTAVKNIPEQARTSLALFFVDWGGNDINHEEYLNNIPDNYPKDEALKMGELLYWCIGGTKKSTSTARKTRSTSKEWKSIIEKTDSKGATTKKAKPLSLPAGVSIHDLTGLHIELLNMLPQRTYTHYTLNQLFIENRNMYDALFQDFVALSPLEHDALQVMQRIVDSGNIERFRLAMMHGTQGKVRKMLTDGTFGANLLDAFSEAQSAVSAYKRGDYASARIGIEKLQLEYGLAPDLFQLGLSEMFIVHAAAPTVRNKKIALKGPNVQLLVSVDKTVGPDGGWPGISAIRDLMSGPAYQIAENGVVGTPLPAEGTPGSRVFKNKTTVAITTDWPFFFAALNQKQNKNKVTVPTSAAVRPTKVGENSFKGLDESERTVRLLIHARVDSGFDDLVPKGTMLVSIRPHGGTASVRATGRRSVKNKHGKKRNRGGNKGNDSDKKETKTSTNGLLKIEDGGNHVYGQVDIIFEDYGGLFDKTEAPAQSFTDRSKPQEAPTDLTGMAAEEQLTADIQAMQPSETSDVDEDETSDLSGLLGRRSAKRRIILGVDYHDYIEPVKKILKKEGGAAGLKPLKAAFPKGTNKAQAKRLLAQMPGVVLHADGDYILVDTLSNVPFDGPEYMEKAEEARSSAYAKNLEEFAETFLDEPLKAYMDYAKQDVYHIVFVPALESLALDLEDIDEVYGDEYNDTVRMKDRRGAFLAGMPARFGKISPLSNSNQIFTGYSKGKQVFMDDNYQRLGTHGHAALLKLLGIRALFNYDKLEDFVKSVFATDTGQKLDQIGFDLGVMYNGEFEIEVARTAQQNSEKFPDDNFRIGSYSPTSPINIPYYGFVFSYTPNKAETSIKEMTQPGYYPSFEEQMEKLVEPPPFPESNPAKGGGRSMGQTIAIELTPKADLTIHKSREDAKWLKMIAKTDPEIKKLYDKFAKTSTRSKAQEGRVKKGKKKGEGITGDSYVVYKGNQTALKMIKAPRKDNNEFVPWLLMIPHILVRQGDDGKILAKKGSDAHTGMKNLLSEVERYYGTPKFKTNLGMGGFRLISDRTARKMRQSGSAGKRVVDIAVHEGVKKVFTTPGVAVELEGKTVRARPDRYKIDGDIMYRARVPSSKKIVHFQQGGGQ
tara:strand:- start:7127 stop:10579 length:3453 start_codon:yes stop_codon:yes gene_type:complete